MRRWSCATIILAAGFTIASPAVAEKVFSSSMDDAFNKLNTLGIGIPLWFLDPNAPPVEGDGRPNTPLREATSIMMHVAFSPEGQVTKCETLMSNATEAFSSGLCSEVVGTMKFKPAETPFTKTFWIHVHQDPATGNQKIQFGPFVQPRPPADRKKR